MSAEPDELTPTDLAPTDLNSMDLAAFEANALEVAGLLRALGNEKRLMVLCKLVEQSELTVGVLAEAVGLSQSALSQHLARMRDEGIVAFRRDGQTIWYRLGDPRIAEMMALLHRLYCRTGA